MLASGVILASLFAEKHPDFIAHPPRSALEMCGSLLDAELCNAAGAIVDRRGGRLPPSDGAGALPIDESGPSLLRANAQKSGEPYEVPAITVD